jgi:GNAT superfamily N-acetyltransferase
MGEALAQLEGSRHAASIAAEAFVAPLRPQTPHYFLGAVGTRRDRQREGLATATLTPILERADQEDEPAFLETSSAANVRFYERLGFTVVSEADVPDRGPHVWTMLRRRSNR